MPQNLHTKAREGARLILCWLKKTCVDHEHGRGLARIALYVNINVFNQILTTPIYVSAKVFAAAPRPEIVIGNVQGRKDERIQFASGLGSRLGLFYLFA